MLYISPSSKLFIMKLCIDDNNWVLFVIFDSQKEFIFWLITYFNKVNVRTAGAFVIIMIFFLNLPLLIKLSVSSLYLFIYVCLQKIFWKLATLHSQKYYLHHFHLQKPNVFIWTREVIIDFENHSWTGKEKEYYRFVMETKLIQDFNNSCSVINQWNDGVIAINSPELHTAIRVNKQW